MQRCLVPLRSISTKIYRNFATTILADDPSSIPSPEQDSNIIKVLPPFRDPKELISTKRARLLYSSRKRGILETDLLLSTFSKKYLHKMNDKELSDYDILMEENDWDIYYWVTGSLAPPSHVKEMSIFPMLVEHSKNAEKKVLRMPDF